jgi:DNA-binding Lrp family transcriptional regulator
MTPQAPNTLIAHKAISLASELSNSEKRVAAAIIDHFNRRTGQCDPSLDCIAELIGMSRRTVMRATDRLQKLGFIRRIRHGGHYHRNSYEPVWSRFLQVEVDWKGRRSARRARFDAPKLSSCSGQSRHVGGDTADPQTFPSNILKETSNEEALLQKPDARSPLNDKSGSAIEANLRPNPPDRERTYRPFGSTPSSTAARDAAERRWNNELTNYFRDRPSIYSRIVEAIDVTLMNAVTDAELSHRGSGLRHLMDELLRRNVIDQQPPVRDERPRGAQKVWRGRGRTGRVAAHFFTQNSENIFFKGHCVGKIEPKR